MRANSSHKRNFLTQFGRELSLLKVSSKLPFASCEKFSATIQSLHGLLKPPIAEAIASSVRSRRANRCRQESWKANTPIRLLVRRSSTQISISESLGVMKPCRGWDAGCKRCSEENGRSYLLRVKLASARPLWLTRSPSTSLPIETFGLLEVNVWNSTGLAKR